MRLPLGGDESDLQSPDGDATVGPVQVCVHARARLELEHLLGFVQRPDAREGRVEVPDQRVAAPL